MYVDPPQSLAGEVMGFHEMKSLGMVGDRTDRQGCQ